MGRAGTELQQQIRETREKARTRTPWRHRTKLRYKLTNIQKAQRKVALLDRKETINQMLEDARAKMMEMAHDMHKHYPRHGEKYYFRLIMQESRLNAKSRTTSRWNAFLSQEMERWNAGLTGGRKKVSQDNIVQEIAAVWRSMTKEEQIAATEERVKEIAERRTARKRKIPIAPIQAFHDTRATTQNIESELRALNVRTSRDALLIMTSPNTSDYGQPYVFHTSQRIANFILLTMRSTLQDFAIKMEGYILSGVQGIKQNYRQTIITLKKEARHLINDKLREISGGALTKVQYKNFDVHITEHSGIIVEHWPLPVFQAPGDISSSVELQILINAWTTGATYFRVMGEDELREWRCRRHGLQPPSVMDSAAPPESTPTLDDPASSPSSTMSTPSSSPPPAASSTMTEHGASSIPLVPTPIALSTLSSASGPATSPSVPSLSAFQALPPYIPTIPSASTSQAAPGSDPGIHTLQLQTTFVNVNVVTDKDGRSIAVSSRPRKTRSDKGTTRKGKATITGAAITPPSLGAAVSGPRKKSKKTAGS